MHHGQVGEEKTVTGGDEAIGDSYAQDHLHPTVPWPRGHGKSRNQSRLIEENRAPSCRGRPERSESIVAIP